MYAEAPIYDSPAAYTPQLSERYFGLPDSVRTCRRCAGEGWDGKSPDGADQHCAMCHGVGYHGIDLGPCQSPKGSEHRVLVYRARLMNGMPILNAADARDHVTNVKNPEHHEPHWTPPEVDDVEFDELCGE